MGLTTGCPLPGLTWAEQHLGRVGQPNRAPKPSPCIGVGTIRPGRGRGTPDLNGDSAAIKDLRAFWVAGPKHVRSVTWTPSVMHDISYQKPLRECLAQTWGATSDSLWSLKNKPTVSSFGFYTHLSLRESNLGIKVPSGQSQSGGANRFPVSQTEPRKTKERAFGSYPRNPKGGERITNATKYILGRA